MGKIALQTVAQRLKEMDDVQILIHNFPDGDTIGSGYALCKMFQGLGKRAFVTCAQEVPSRYAYITDAVEKQEFTPKFIVAVDVADMKLLGAGYEQYEGKIDLCIDHHPSNLGYAAQTYVDGTAAATCEIIYDLIIEILGSVDMDMANALYTGIATDTGCFKFTNTTPKTHVIAAELMKTGIPFGEINRIMFDTKAKSRLMIETMAMDGIEFACDDRCALITVTTEMIQSTGARDDELEGITALPRQVEGVVLGITIRQRGENEYKISVRSHEPVDASAFCKQFGGGGHARAAGCEMQGSLAEIKKILLAAANKTLE